ncbi:MULTISPECIES: phosphotransferase [unclassified Mesorhizobium]|uniref:phosphotransferase n=1 Tax=unclassified Mesorhizobium TaxID=325217 RepID=UPI000868A284|nr:MULTISPECIES: phosphotransferase [unclassified Mesorhizobium]MBN9257841.1 phosphotransferase [Mesorhizobium sp.]ODT12547.1 MAG: homoserine kinase [Mesorhizobium sp. SCN 65-12]OJX79174.1 MAG: homoserine kinase [Mesorhizobium sp. 65-26]
MTDRPPELDHDALRGRAAEALRHWPAPAQQPALLKYRENAIFRIALADGTPAVLRLHRAGYHDEAALRSELDWMTALRLGGLPVPSPVPAGDGRALVRLAANGQFGEQHVDVVSWVEGDQLGQSGVPLAQSPERQAEIFFQLGAAMARMHNLADAWQPPRHFQRPSWDVDGLLGERPVWGRFWDCAGVVPTRAPLLRDLRQRLLRAVENAEVKALDYGLIHADLVRENVLVTETGVSFIDFDDAGYGFRLFDLATTLLKNRLEPHYATIERALIAGYRSQRELPEAAVSLLPLFLVLRSLTYIGWNSERPEMPGAAERLARTVEESLELAGRLDRGP